MNIMPVIPTVNNKNSRPQSKQAFGATFTPESKIVLDKIAQSLPEKVRADFLQAIKPITGEIARIMSKKGIEPTIDLHHLGKSLSQPEGFRAYIDHPKTNLPSFTFDSTYAPEDLANVLPNIKKQATFVADELDAVMNR